MEELTFTEFKTLNYVHEVFLIKLIEPDEADDDFDIEEESSKQAIGIKNSVSRLQQVLLQKPFGNFCYHHLQ